MRSVLYFSTQTCTPCKMFKPLVQSTALELGINVNYIDAQQNPSMAQAHSVTSVPTIVVMDNGITVNKAVGAMSKPQLINLLKG